MEIEIHEQKERDTYMHDVYYKDHKLERQVLLWDFLGLPDSPNLFVMSEDNKLVRYDYDNAFRYRILDDDFEESGRCSRYLFFMNYHQCDPEHIKVFRRELMARYRTNLREVISEIGVTASQCLKGKDLSEINNALREITRDYEY